PPERERRMEPKPSEGVAHERVLHDHDRPVVGVPESPITIVPVGWGVSFMAVKEACMEDRHVTSTRTGVGGPGRIRGRPALHHRRGPHTVGVLHFGDELVGHGTGLPARRRAERVCLPACYAAAAGAFGPEAETPGWWPSVS